MTNSKKGFKKLVFGVVATSLLTSTVATTIPFNVLAAEATSNQSQVGLGSGLQNVSEAPNLVQNNTFTGVSNWLPILYKGDPNDGRTFPSQSYGAVQTNGYYPVATGSQMKIKPSGDGSVTVWMGSLGQASLLTQTIQTIPGHYYQLKYTPTNINNGLYALIVRSGTSAYSGKMLWRNTNSISWTTPGGKERVGTFRADSNVISLGLNTNTNGTVKYSNISIVDISDIGKTTIDSLDVLSTQVTGRGEADADVTIKTDAGTIATGKTDKDGNYSITIPAQAEGTVVTASVTNGYGTSDASVTVQGIALAETTISELNQSSRVVSGQAEPEKLVIVKNSAGSTIASGYSDSEGHYQFDISPQRIGDTIKATVKVGDQVSAAETIVQDTRTPEEPTVNPVKDTDTVVTGRGEAGNTISVKIGDQTYTAPVNSDGTFSVVIPKQDGGTKIDVTQKNNDNNKVSPVKEVTVADTTLAAPTISPVKQGDTRVTVKGEPNTSVTLTTPDNDKTIKVTDANGEATFVVDPAKAGDTYIATQKGGNGKVSPEASVTVSAVVTKGTITTSNFTLGKDRSIVGNYTGDVKSFRVTIDGTVYNGGTIDSSKGTYAFYAFDKISKTGTFKIEGLDASGRILDTKNANIVNSSNPIPSTSGTVAPNTFTIGTDRYLTASYTGDVKAVKVTINGVDYTGGTVANGSVNFYIGDKISSTSDSVKITALDAYGRELDRKSVTVANKTVLTSGTVSPNVYTIGADRSLSATYTGDVKSVKVTINGVDYVGGTVANGSVSFYVGDKISSKSDVVKMTALDLNGKVLDQKNVNLASTSDNTVGTITPNQFSAGSDNYLTATYTGDVKSVKVTINGQVYSGGTVQNGQVNFYIGNKITSSADNVMITAYDLNNKKLDEKEVVVKNINGDIQPNAYTVPGDTV
ncbi:Uncharacterised protein [Listeria fleischmannii subsp. fleischmannii]|uniref:Cell wall-associated protease n=2 Tax=Listeria fleischmannii TaxID=1069827 RepID=A0A2X3H3U4_9LIST|nr:immunoglobulin-like domain-containing protein [Listeria fleischmannii]SQC67201.1 Uncharacterised protein [Listeria fleischmannii subsp. fleischmannii]